ncbi:Shedu anti-phage system protein SduA domain-containing protein [Neobacillus mesonae]|uniref:Shedu protein SduA C-terminal domain-containing protein n=1 Tax=Neobacillus mesonae TaxID=1193713 RepID=A0A3Q9QRZ2_9BACI|nr:Shedu anti-phage system protein SduA domain-containing protein [Neobacillus mesonae]AZU60270.1 hypothetical protein CHR53_02740 [Neobacillus mesonae]
MKIYDRDYNFLTEQEENEWEVLKEKEIIKRLGKLKVKRSLYREYPVAVRHKMSLFPNNHLDIVDLQNEEQLLMLIEEYSEIIANQTMNERDILNWIKEKRAYFIIASIMKNYYSFGHHDAFIIPEFQLGNSYQVDYLLIGKSSGGYEFIFVELEHPNKNTTISSGHLGETFRKGLNQVSDWSSWLEGNYISIYETFIKYKNYNHTLPIEFLKYDSSRIHFAVIAGKREHFNEKTYEIKRQKLKERTLLLHYENLYDMSKNLIGQVTY